VTASFCTAAATGAASFTVLRVKIFHGWNRANPTATPTTATTATVIQMAFFRLRGLLGGRVSRPVIALSWVGAVEMQVGCSIRRPDGVRRKQVCSHYGTLTLLALEDRERVGARWTDHGLNSLAGRSASAVTTSHLRFRGLLVACLDGGAKWASGIEWPARTVAGMNIRRRTGPIANISRGQLLKVFVGRHFRS
jgi:hypothetical protein